MVYYVNVFTMIYVFVYNVCHTRESHLSLLLL